MQEHRLILEACLAGDAERASEEMRNHLQGTVDSIHAVLDAQRSEEEKHASSSTS